MHEREQGPVMPEPRSWPRCGSSGRSASVQELRQALHRAENPQGVLRGNTRPPRMQPPPPRNSTTSSVAVVQIAGAAISLVAAPTAPRAAPPPRISSSQKDGKALDLRRAHKLIRFLGSPGDLPLEWSCAICCESAWDRKKLLRMPRCGHVFHEACVAKWFLRSGDCPYCRQPV